MADKLIEMLDALPRVVEAGKLAVDPRVMKLLVKARERIEALDRGAWASHSETLAKKALATVHDRMERCNRNEITVDACFAAVDAIYDAIVGLVPMKECADVILEARKEILPWK